MILSKTKHCLAEYLSEVKQVSFTSLPGQDEDNTIVELQNGIEMKNMNNINAQTEKNNVLKFGYGKEICSANIYLTVTFWLTLRIDWRKRYDVKSRTKDELKFVLLVEGKLKLRKSDVHFDGQIIWVRTAPGFEPAVSIQTIASY